MENEKKDVMFNTHVSYTDLRGDAKLAWHIDEHTALEKIASDSGLSKNDYQPIGLKAAISRKGFHLNLFMVERYTPVDEKKQCFEVATNFQFNDFVNLIGDLQFNLWSRGIDVDKVEYGGRQELSDVTPEE